MNENAINMQIKKSGRIVTLKLSKVFRPHSTPVHLGSSIRFVKDQLVENVIVRPRTAFSRSNLPQKLTKMILRRSEKEPRSILKTEKEFRNQDTNRTSLFSEEQILCLLEKKTQKRISFDETHYSSFEMWLEGSPHSSEEFEVDLSEEKKDTEANAVDPCGKTIYRKSCSKLGITPISRLLHNLGDRNIQLSHRYLGTTGAKSLALALVSNTVTECLNLSDNYLEVEGAIYIAKMMKENLFITDLNLSNNFIQSEGIAIIAEMLEVNTTLKILSLAGNNLKDRDAAIFVDALKNNTSLTSLDLSHNRFSEKGGEMLAQGLVLNESLISIDLSWNSLRGKGAVAIANALKVNSSLEIIDLSWNGFEISACVAMQFALQKNTTLRAIDLTNNRLTKKSAMRLALGLKKNTTLENLILNLNMFGNDGLEVLLKAAAVNEKLNILSIEDMTINKENFKLIHDLENSKNILVFYGGVAGCERRRTSGKLLKLFTTFTRDHSSELATTFHQQDRDNTGLLPFEQLKNCFRETGLKLTSKQFELIIEKLDTCIGGFINYRDLLSEEMFFNLDRKLVFY